MKLIKISEGTFINPEEIDAIVSETNLSIIINGVPYVVTKDYTTLMTDLMGAGLEYNKQNWAG